MVRELKRYIHMYVILVQRHAMALAPYVSWRERLATYCFRRGLGFSSCINRVGRTHGAFLLHRAPLGLACCHCVGSYAFVHRPAICWNYGLELVELLPCCGNCLSIYWRWTVVFPLY